MGFHGFGTRRFSLKRIHIALTLLEIPSGVWGQTAPRELFQYDAWDVARGVWGGLPQGYARSAARKIFTPMVYMMRRGNAAATAARSPIWPLNIKGAQIYGRGIRPRTGEVGSLFGVVCGRGRNPTLRLWPTIFSGKIDVFPGDRRSRLISSMTSVAPA